MKKKAKKAAPKKANKPAAKKPVAKKKPAPKKPAAKKVVPKAKVKPAKKVVAKPVAKKVSKKPEPKKPIAKKPEVKKIEPKKVAVKPISKNTSKKVAKEVPVVAAPAPVAKPKRLPPPKKKRFIVLPTGPLVPSEVKDDVKKPKGLYVLEYTVYSSPDVLFEFISTAGGLEKWFAPKVNLKENIFVFSWGDEQKQAKLLALKEREFVRFRWMDQPDKKFFEFRMQIDDLTSEVALMVTDFADTQEELEESSRLWNTQIDDLLHALGSA